MIAWVLVLALFAGPASALGLGPIEVRSQRNQPLLAEIQVISSDPSELDRLQARLASPETFARIGLQPPQGIVSDLQFALALDANGRPVIRVTSVAPVQQSLLTFLVEVDWGQGRLVREYSALLDAPRTVAAPSQPPIQAPVLQPSNTIVRPAEPALAANPVPVPEPAPESTPEPATEPAPVASAARETQGDPDAIAPSPVAPAVEPVPARPVAVVGQGAEGEYGPVKAGDTLGAIASGVRAEGETLEQAMVALLRANPEAFIAGNLNLVKQGAVLRVPASAERSQYSAAEAAAVVRAQIGEWREMRRPVLQPDAVAEAATTPPPAPGTRTASGQETPRAAGARLEIVPPSQGSGQRAGTRSGIDAGGEGDMLRQELLQKDEALAARGAEVEELKARVADLERLQSQQQQLIQLKDSELAAAQQRLAATNAQPVPAAATTAAGQPASAADAGASGNAGLLIWVGGALVLAALLAWWLLRRRRGARPAAPVFDTATLAAAVPVRVESEEAAVAGRPTAESTPAATLRERVHGNPPPAVVPTWHAGLDAPGSSTTADTHSANLETPSRDRPFPDTRPVAADPVSTSGAGTSSATPANAGAAASTSAAAGPDRLELARAYLDLGDTATARGLLLEVTASDDPFAREDAARMLRDLG